MALFNKLKFGPYELANRIAMAPMTRGRATEGNVPTEYMKLYYAQRASAGMIISEGTGITRQGLPWYCAPGIYNSAQINEWKIITDAVHKEGGIIGLQLWHLGRSGHPDITGLPRLVSASPKPMKGEVPTKPTWKQMLSGDFTPVMKTYETPYPLLNKDGKNGSDNYVDDGYKYTIEEVVNDYGVAAENAVHKAGFDFVEIHAANGYIIDQFIQTVTNERNDEYGGSIDNRLRFMREVVQKICGVVDKRLVGIRLSPNGVFGQMGSKDNNETFTEAITWLTLQNIGYIHLMDGLGFGFHDLSKPFTIEMGREIIDKNTTDKANPTLLIGNVGYTQELAEEKVSKGIADMIAFGRPYIGNPDLVSRFKNNQELNGDVENKYWWSPNEGCYGYVDQKTFKQ